MLDWTSSFLRDKGFASPRLNAERLLAHILGLERVELYLNFERPLSRGEQSGFKRALQRRLRHEPLQYIISETEFYSLPFTVTPEVMIPRPETEVLVECALSRCKTTFSRAATIRCLDIGTGSGNIAVALAHHAPTTILTALDISENALEVARENARRHNIEERCRFHAVDIFDETTMRNFGPFDLILSNPPYIPTATLNTLDEEIFSYEPHRALDGGVDGLDLYRQIARLLPSLASEKCAVLLEIGERQADAVSQLLSSAGFRDAEVVKDLAAKDRVISAQRSNTHGEKP